MPRSPLKNPRSALRRGVEDFQAGGAIPNTGKAVAAGLLGAPADVVQMMVDLQAGNARVPAPKIPLTSDYFAGLLGADLSRPSGLLGLLGSPDPMDFGRLAGVGLLAKTRDLGKIPYHLRPIDIKLPEKVYRGTSGSGQSMLGKGLYTSPSRGFATKYGDVVEMGADSLPKKPLILRSGGRGTAPDIFNDFLLSASGERNMRAFHARYGDDPSEFIKALGYDGVWIGDEIVKY